MGRSSDQRGAAALNGQATIHVDELLEAQEFGRWHLSVMLLCFFMLLVEGMDYNALAVAAPEIARAWQISNSDIGIAFGAGNLGVLIGTLVFSKIGDRFGRRPGIIVGVFIYSVPTLFTALVDSATELSVLRFLAGLGMGGVIPNAIALLTEIAPKRYKSRAVIIPFVGIGLGVAAIGAVGAAFIPRFGWPAVFLIPGAAGVLVAASLLRWLPESVRFLAWTRPDSPSLRHSLARLAPGLKIDGNTRFVVRQQEQKTFRLADLFRDGNGVITPLLWICFFFESLTFVVLASWLPTLLESAGLSPTQASLTFAYVGLANLFSQALMALLLDRFHFNAIFLGSLLTIGCFVLFGMPWSSQTQLILVTVLLLASAGATHSSLNGVVGNFYPTTMRATGIGFATGFGRVAFILGPVIAGYVMAQNLTFRELTILIMSPYLPVALVCLILTRLYGLRIARERRYSPGVTP